MRIAAAAFDWHGAPLSRATPVTADYRNTQNVRRFLVAECGPDFRFDRAFIGWIKNASPKTLGEVADEWRRRRIQNGAAPI